MMSPVSFFPALYSAVALSPLILIVIQRPIAFVAACVGWLAYISSLVLNSDLAAVPASESIPELKVGVQGGVGRLLASH